jgi:chromosome segregation ATPase
MTGTEITSSSASEADTPERATPSNPVLQKKQQPRQQQLQKLSDENQTLKERMEEMQQVLRDLHKEASLQKMKSTITVGSMRLEVDSLREDRQFLIEKYYGLKQKVEMSTNELAAKEEEWNALKEMKAEDAHSI